MIKGYLISRQSHILYATLLDRPRQDVVGGLNKKSVIMPIIMVIYGLYDGINYHLVGGFNHLEKYISQWEG